MSTKLSHQELRRLLRVTLGSALGFTIAKLMNWPYGLFFTVYPMLLLGLVPVFNRLVAFQMLAAAAVNLVEVWLLYALFQHHPLPMTLGVFALYCWRFRLMASTPYFVFGAIGLVTLSTLLHFSSYPDTSPIDMITSVSLASLLSVISAALLYWLIPETEPVALPPRQALSGAEINHRMLMGAGIGTLSFIVFQVLDLRDSLSAQVATVLVLFPMTYQGAMTASWKRLNGVVVGCALALGMQVLMYDLINHFLLVLAALVVCLLVTARLHFMERAGSGAGFGAMTTVGILFGQYLLPNKDMLYGGAYRITSVAVALLVLMMVSYLLDKTLNRFESTRNAPAAA
ncbi:DUF2955 domain-containing protein [Gallaecimonas kandeliae]|uniref:DUF2955 domain-containing protein n=1 Tax=Gallaecimonas kandeliae TaxID=3029055 RepID=UPI002649E3BC|nr:DUF2955 domain-containing protein [Gallaecimonas kandeliae]WKE64705.1 DUF2955 domain-containing protein [Gallaecimonas kandeliae]